MSEEVVEVSSVRYWIIRKRSRDTLEPYAGGSCARAGVIPGCIYADANGAAQDAAKLELVNPVGFEVVEVERPLSDFVKMPHLQGYHEPITVVPQETGEASFYWALMDSEGIELELRPSQSQESRELLEEIAFLINLHVPLRARKP